MIMFKGTAYLNNKEGMQFLYRKINMKKRQIRNCKIRDFIIRGNIFQEKTLDGSLYCVFYVLIPVIITAASLVNLNRENITNVAYCYVTILISSLGCIYDAINRWEDRIGSDRNRKLFIMILFLLVVAIYCMVVIFFALIASKIIKGDIFLFAYVASNIIAIGDWFNCILIKLAKRETVK